MGPNVNDQDNMLPYMLHEPLCPDFAGTQRHHWGLLSTPILAKIDKFSFSEKQHASATLDHCTCIWATTLHGNMSPCEHITLDQLGGNNSLVNGPHPSM